MKNLLLIILCFLSLSTFAQKRVTINVSGGGAGGGSALTAAQENRLFTRQTFSDPTGTVTIDVDEGGQAALSLSTAGGRTLAFSNLNTGDIVKMYFDNTTGGAVTLTLPANSFIAGTGSAATIEIPTGKSLLTLSDYNGTNYLIVQQSY